MRLDSIGLFWQETKRTRPQPPIPDTGWKPPSTFPNLARAKILSFDVETYDPELADNGPGWARGKGHIVGFSVGADQDGRWYFPIRHEVEPDYNLDPHRALAWLRDTLSNPLQPKLGANLIYDIGWLAHEGVETKGDLVDVQYAEALLEERGQVSLEALAQKYLGVGKTSDLLKQWIMDAYAPSESKWRSQIYRAPPRLAGPYGEGDADLPIRLAAPLYARLEREGLVNLFRMECELIPLMVAMRMAGVSVDTAKATELRDKLEVQGKEEQEKLDCIAGTHVDINAAASLARAFDRLKIAYQKTETGKPSFTKDFLEKVTHPIGQSIRDIRKYDKFRNTFIQSYILDSNVNGKVYCSFHPLRGDEGGTRSGRLSSSHPNLQNIPVRDKVLGPLLRSMFIPDQGHQQLRHYDYSQIEYRFLIHYAVGPGSDEARALFNSNPKTDYHEMTRELVHTQTGVLMDRRPIKNLNFGLIFGMGKDKLGQSLNLNKKDAAKFMEMYHRGVPFARPTMEATMKEADREGVITTFCGRRSRFDQWEPDSYDRTGVPLPFEQAILQYGQIRRAHLHKALNRRLQGSAADLMKVAMWKCWKSGVFNATGVPRLTVHDELDFSDPGGKDEAFKEMHRILETALTLRIPIRADCDVGPNWGDLTPLQST